MKQKPETIMIYLQADIVWGFFPDICNIIIDLHIF